MQFGLTGLQLTAEEKLCCNAAAKFIGVLHVRPPQFSSRFFTRSLTPPSALRASRAAPE